jgi:two-component system KDP operon response regulator KdpE
VSTGTPAPVPGPRVLVVEDEARFRRFLRVSLEGRGYEVHEAGTGAEGIRAAAEYAPELVLLDLGLPDMDGIEVVSRLRGWTDVPVLVLSAREREGQKVAALDAGADDYLTKPFGVPELLARMRVALRHAGRFGAGPGRSLFTAGPLAVDLAGRSVTVDGDAVHLTPLEYRILEILVRHAGKVVTHTHLQRTLWGPEARDQGHTLRVHMAHLRRKIEADPARPRLLRTETGVGYRLEPEEEPTSPA